MSSWSMQRIRNFVIPYFIYLFLVYLSPLPFQQWLTGLFPGLEITSIDLKKPLLPILIVIVIHYLMSDWRLRLNEPFFDRVNETIVQRVKAELGDRYNSWQKIRPAYYHVIDGDRSLTYLSDRIKANGLVWFGFTDLRLASILTFVIWGIATFVAYHFNAKDVNSWMTSATVSLVLLVCSALGSEITTRRHIKLVNDQLNQMFPLHNQDLLSALERE
jgi:hypothetical protein